MSEPALLNAPTDLEDDPSELPPVPPLGERIREVLLHPWRAFSQHHAAWGWAAPWLIVSALGVLAGVATVANGQLEPLVAQQIERQQEALESRGVKLDADKLDFQRKLGLFSAKVGSVLGPPLIQLWCLFLMGTVAFLAALVWGPRGRADLLGCLSLVAWCSLAQGVGYLAMTLAALLGSPAPSTSLMHLVDPTASPLAAGLLGRVDPVLIFYYVLFAAGLHGSCRLTRRQGGLVAGGCYLGVSLLGLIPGLLSRSAGG